MTALSDLRIPYGAYWSTPFHPMAGRAVRSEQPEACGCDRRKGCEAKNNGRWRRSITPYSVLTVPQEKSFWGAPLGG
jgi:hypothetical protein